MRKHITEIICKIYMRCLFSLVQFLFASLLMDVVNLVYFYFINFFVLVKNVVIFVFKF